MYIFIFISYICMYIVYSHSVTYYILFPYPFLPIVPIYIVYIQERLRSRSNGHHIVSHLCLTSVNSAKSN